MNRPDREQRQTPKGKGGDTPAAGAEGEMPRSAPQPIADLDFLRGLIAAVDDSSIDSLEISRGGTRIRISKSPSGVASVTQFAPSTHGEAPTAPQPVPQASVATPAAPATEAATPAPAPAANNWIDIKSPMVGTFYRSPSPEAPAYVEVGSRVVKGQTLCILEAMKLMNELEADLAGVIREVAVENGEPVEYGQVLYRIEPEA
jgi:acetyl-CoA carboxylase biotin carboxyl carrier protein